MGYSKNNLLQQASEEWDKSAKKAGSSISHFCTFSVSQKYFGGNMNVDFNDVWDALNRYITHTVLSDKKAIKIPLFGTFAMSQEGSFDFYFAEKFIREFNLNTVGLPVLHRSTVSEEFNWVKCALKFSEKSSKEQISIGVKRIVNTLGWAIANQGATPVSIDFEVGRLEVKDGKPCFTATTDVCKALGAKAKSTFASDYKPTNTFTAPSAEVAKSLRLDASTVVKSVASAANNANYEPGLNESQNMVLLNAGAANAEVAMQLARQQRRNSGSGSARSVSTSVMSSSVGGKHVSKQEFALKEAMSRYLDCVEQRASAAIKDRALWEDHVKSCIHQELEEHNNRYQMERQNQEFIQRQMADNSVRRKDQRFEDIVAASAHEFPKFSEAIDHELKRQQKEQQAVMRGELADMISTKRAYDKSVEDFEMGLALQQSRQNKKKYEADKKQEADDERAQRNMLKEAWGIQTRIGKIQSTIDGFDMKQVNNGYESARSSRGSARRRPVGAAIAKNRSPIV
eukprot:gene218-146_t